MDKAHKPDKPERPDPSRSLRRDGTTRHRDQLGTGQGEESWPRLPAERDESGDSQDQGVRPDMKQAAADLRKGLQDTDRKPAMDEAYEKQKGAGAPGTAPAAPDQSGAGVRRRR